MSYIGKEPADSFISFAKQDFTTSATTSYTLDNAVANENELALFINFVRQEPTTAYTASGTTLTLTSATASTDDMYCVYLGQAKQTVNAPDGSVGTSQLASEAVTNAKVASTIITGQTAETSIADADTILIHDDSASALRKMTKANFVSGIGGANTPAFRAKSASGQSVANTTHTKVVFGTELFDTDSAFTDSRFTVPSGKAGKYWLYAQAGQQAWSSNRFLIYLIKNNAVDISASEETVNQSYYQTCNTACIADLAEGDYVEVKLYHDNGSAETLSTSDRTCFEGFKLI